MKRRELLIKLGTAMAAVPLGRLVAACSASESASDSGATDDAAAIDADAGGWATGGTASMTDKATYPNPFASGAPATCSLTGALTQGPCYDSQSETRQDISYGQDGLPMRLMLQIVDASCAPIEGAVVEVWHVAPHHSRALHDHDERRIVHVAVRLRRFARRRDRERATDLQRPRQA